MERQDLMYDMMKDILKENVNSYLEQVNIDNILKETIREIVRESIGNELKYSSEKYVNELVKEEIENILKEPVKIDDGWGHKQNYSSFEDLFKDVFKTKINTTWEMQRTIEKVIKDRVEEFMKAKAKEVTEKAVGLVIDELGKSGK
jgi:histone H3/H4